MAKKKTSAKKSTTKKTATKTASTKKTTAKKTSTRSKTLAKSSAKTKRKAKPAVVTTLTHDQIAARAYELWLAKGQPANQDVRIWKEAEATLSKA